MRKTKLPTAFAPGEFIREELAARGWTQGQLAKVLGRPVQVINEIVRGKKRITAATAKELGLAFGTGPELWLNLENAYQLATSAAPDPRIKRRAQMLSAA